MQTTKGGVQNLPFAFKCCNTGNALRHKYKSKMIDFIKILILNKDQINIIWQNELLTYKSNEDKLKSIETGEISRKEVRRYKNLEFVKYASKLEITGSIHYLFNGGKHNANDLNVSDCINEIIKLKHLFQLDFSLCKVINLEFGVIILIPFPVKKVVQYLKFHERNLFVRTKDLQHSKISQSFSKNGSVNLYKIIKAYAKGLQLFEGVRMADENTFRFEIKSKRSKYINSLGVFTLEDLTRKDVYTRFGKEIIKEWQKVLLLDRLTDFNNDKRANKYINSDFWEDIESEHRNKFSYHKRKYLELLADFPENIFTSISNLIDEKISAISTPQHKTKLVQYLEYLCGDYALNITKPCAVTGIDISMQKEDSILLSHSGLKYYYNTNRKLYNSVKRKYLSNKWQKTDFKTEIKEIAHNIRNTISNQRIKQKRIYPKNQFRLFQINI